MAGTMPAPTPTARAIDSAETTICHGVCASSPGRA
jgi:hypothetical protein